MIKTHFVFAVSFVAMLAVSSAWANDPADTSSTTDTVATEHTVYKDQTPTDEDSGAGIAGVSYVNRAVNKAGASAQAAEAHAAAAGASALDAASSAAAAAESAATANETLKSKADKSELSKYATVEALNSAKNELSNGNTTAVGGLQDQIDDLATDKEATANKLTSLATTTVSETNKDTLYPSVGKVQSMINALDSTSSGTGAVVTGVSQANGKVTVTMGNVKIPSGSATSTTYATIWVE